MTALSDAALDAWLAQLAAVPPWDSLLAAAADERARRGYGHTLREILQQPLLWEGSAERIFARTGELQPFIRRDGESSVRPIVLTGSGSSEYVGHCVAPILQARLGAIARAVPAALFLTHADSSVTAADPPLVVSFARSGESPESIAAVELLLDEHPGCRHLAITCNAAGRLAAGYASDSRVMAIVLDPRTHDRSLVMTSSFTNMAVAGQALAALGGGEAAFRARVRQLAALGREVLLGAAADLAEAAARPFRAACFLGAGAQFGAARESALKVLEMSGGAVSTLVETPLGLRHGPMAALRDDTLVVAALPASRRARGYALDVLREIDRKRIAAARVVIGDAFPGDLLGGTDVGVAIAGYNDLDEGLAAVLDVLVGQILAFFRCMAGGLRPDSPSPDGVINRVVAPFPLYR